MTTKEIAQKVREAKQNRVMVVSKMKTWNAMTGVNYTAHYLKSLNMYLVEQTAKGWTVCAYTPSMDTTKVLATKTTKSEAIHFTILREETSN